MADAGLDLEHEDRDRIPVILGTGVGGLTTLDASFAQFYGSSLARPGPLTIPKSMLNAGVSHISIDLNLRGESYAVASACASGTHAIGQAHRLIRSGAADIAVTGGAEACLTVGTIKAWESMRVLSGDGCRPFSTDRSGLVLGEGAAVLVLEDAKRAKAREATIYGFIAGFAASADAADLTSPNSLGGIYAMKTAVLDANLRLDQIDYINAHGTGTQVNDATEAEAIKSLFGNRPIAVSSTKGVLGHSLGATGAVEAALTLLAMHNCIKPPTAGWRVRDPACEIDIVHGKARKGIIRAALSNSFAFGGLNAVLALRKREVT